MVRALPRVISPPSASNLAPILLNPDTSQGLTDSQSPVSYNTIYSQDTTSSHCPVPGRSSSPTYDAPEFQSSDDPEGSPSINEYSDESTLNIEQILNLTEKSLDIESQNILIVKESLEDKSKTTSAPDENDVEGFEDEKLHDEGLVEETNLGVLPDFNSLLQLNPSTTPSSSSNSSLYSPLILEQLSSPSLGSASSYKLPLTLSYIQPREFKKKDKSFPEYSDLQSSSSFTGLLRSEVLMQNTINLPICDLQLLIRELAADNERLKKAVHLTNIYLQKEKAVISYWIGKLNVSPLEGEKTKDSKSGADSNISVQNLSSQLDVAEEAQVQLSQDLQRVTAEKLELVNHVSSLQLQLEHSRLEKQHGLEELDRLQQEKWELSAVNTDLQQRLQQTVALAHMQAEGKDTRLQEELGTLLVQLEEERQVTARLSKSLELERRKVESLEQKSKGSSGKKDGARRRSSLLPEEIRDSEMRLVASMELYRQRCDNLGVSLAGCQQQLDRDSWQPDLATEINKLRKLLSEEKRSCYGEGARLNEVHQLFEQVYHDYTSVLETMKQSQQEIKKVKGQSVLENIKESNIRDNMDSLTARLMDTEESLIREKETCRTLQERLAQAELEVESLPLLRAQVEVYQSDFNAEREARERIAGEKADLLDQINKMRQQTDTGGLDPVPVQQRTNVSQLGIRAEGHQTRNTRPEGQPRLEGELVGVVRDRFNQFADKEDDRLPLPVRQHNLRNTNGEERTMELNCPKCGREFRNTTLLTRHVNDCLDRDY